MKYNVIYYLQKIENEKEEVGEKAMSQHFKGLRFSGEDLNLNPTSWF